MTDAEVVMGGTGGQGVWEECDDTWYMRVAGMGRGVASICMLATHYPQESKVWRSHVQSDYVQD